MKALLAIDDSAESALALETAATVAWPPDSRVEIVSVLPTDTELVGGPWPAVAYVQSTDVRERLLEERRRLLDEAAEAVRRESLHVAVHIREGRTASVILDEAERIGADLIILGARSHGSLERILLGSVSAEVVDGAHCPVLVARRPTARRILLASDGSPDAALTAEFVGTSGLFQGGATRVLHVVDVPAAWWLGFSPTDTTIATDAYISVVEEAGRHGREVVETAVERLRSEGFESQPVVREGSAAGVIVAEAEAWGADLIAVGTRGHGLLKRLILGSTARTVLHHAPMSVLIVRPTATAAVPA